MATYLAPIAGASAGMKNGYSIASKSSALAATVGGMSTI